MSARIARQRLDTRLVEEGLAADVKTASALIMEGRVLAGGQPAKGAGTLIRDDVPVALKGGDGTWVSRGAYKLLTAVERFGLDLSGRVCLDVGSSTGGFTQVMLARGAARVYSVDVGYGLLDWSLRSDSRVSVMERTNARLLTPEMFSPAPDFAASDASFISLRLLLEPMANVTLPESEAVVLVKPQFEARKADVGEGGVVRSPSVHVTVLGGLLSFIAEETPWCVTEASWSSIKGPKGNIEFLLHLRKGTPSAEIDVENLGMDAHEALDRR